MCRKSGISKGYLQASSAVKMTPVATLLLSALTPPPCEETHNPNNEATTSTIRISQTIFSIKQISDFEITTQAAIKAMNHTTNASRATTKQAACNFNSGGLVTPTASLFFAAIECRTTYAIDVTAWHIRQLNPSTILKSLGRLLTAITPNP
jgi:hypothetical protein